VALRRTASYFFYDAAKPFLMHRVGGSGVGGLPALPPPDILNVHPIPHFKQEKQWQSK
jgi:hypothetical protein